jgi:PAS domain S-box-containing protein
METCPRSRKAKRANCSEAQKSSEKLLSPSFIKWDLVKSFPEDRMATDHRLHRAEEALREREITFSALAKVAPVGIMRFDADGRCNYVNDRWSAITGLSIDEAIGDGWKNAIHPADRAAVLESWRGMRDPDKIFREEYRIVRTDGTIRWILAEGAALRSYSREPLGFIRTVTDITRHRELEGELTAAREKLEQRVKERTADLETEMSERQKLEKRVLELKDNEHRRFSQDLHDGLGQCLTGLLFHVLALERDLTVDRSSFAPAASKIAALVNQSINQAHDLARGIDPVPLRPDGLMSALGELVRELCDASPTKCSFQCDEPILLEDNALATHLYRIAQEAISNAIKHSKASQVTVRLEKLPKCSALVVTDDGVGISKRQNNRGGRGLNIIKHRARLIDAALDVKSTLGRGTTVRCEFKSAKSRQSRK